MRSDPHATAHGMRSGTMERVQRPTVDSQTTDRCRGHRDRKGMAFGKREHAMRSGLHGTFATLLLMVPVLSIPALAIFGIPQFAPVVASPVDEGRDQDRERRIGQSARPAGDGLLGELEDAPDFGFESAAGSRGKQGDSVPISRPGGSSWDDQHQVSPPAETREAPRIGPLWPDDSRGIDRRSGPSGSNAESLDRFTGKNGLRNEPPPETKFGQPAPSSRPPRNPNRDGDPLPLPDGTSEARDIPKSYHRDRESLSDRLEPSNGPSNVHASLTWQSAVQRLNELEIRNFRLERGHQDNQFIFICSYTPSDSPRVSNRFEAEADEPLKAVEKVLEQIEEWQKRQ